MPAVQGAAVGAAQGDIQYRRKRNQQQYDAEFDESLTDPFFLELADMCCENSEHWTQLADATAYRHATIVKRIVKFHAAGQWTQYQGSEFALDDILGVYTALSQLTLFDNRIRLHAVRMKYFITNVVRNSSSTIDPDDNMHTRALITLKNDVFSLVSERAMLSLLCNDLSSRWSTIASLWGTQKRYMQPGRPRLTVYIIQVMI